MLNRKKLYGVGVNDYHGEMTNNERSMLRRWKNMLSRCYSGKQRSYEAWKEYKRELAVRLCVDIKDKRIVNGVMTRYT